MPTPEIQLRICRLACALCLSVLTASASAAQSATALAGTWTLVAFTSHDSTGRVAYPMGERVEGLLSYDASGHVSAHIMRADRPTFASGDRARGTEHEVREAFVGYLAYYGRYTVDTTLKTVTHHIHGATFPNWVGVDQHRHYELRGDRLTIRTPPMLAGGAQLTTVLVWQRVR